MTQAFMQAFAPLAGEVSALVETLQQSVALISTRHGQGAGVIWESDGLILTNHHVAHRDHAEVELADGRLLPARVIARDPHNDLAALRVRARGLPAVPYGDSTVLRVGELVLAVGHPFGLRSAATLGVISATGNTTWMGSTRREIVQADLALAPGNSGGPLVTMEGRVIGIASMVFSPGIAVAVPSHLVRRFVAALHTAEGSGQPGRQAA